MEIEVIEGKPVDIPHGDVVKVRYLYLEVVVDPQTGLCYTMLPGGKLYKPPIVGMRTEHAQGWVQDYAIQYIRPGTMGEDVDPTWTYEDAGKFYPSDTLKVAVHPLPGANRVMVLLGKPGSHGLARALRWLDKFGRRR